MFEVKVKGSMQNEWERLQTDLKGLSGKATGKAWTKGKNSREMFNVLIVYLTKN